jgi:hypothetical protein
MIAVQEAAYYLWLNGSSDTEANWFNAVAQVAALNKDNTVDITGKLTSYYRESR